MFCFFFLFFLFFLTNEWINQSYQKSMVMISSPPPPRKTNKQTNKSVYCRKWTVGNSKFTCMTVEQDIYIFSSWIYWANDMLYCLSCFALWSMKPSTLLSFFHFVEWGRRFTYLFIILIHISVLTINIKNGIYMFFCFVFLTEMLDFEQYTVFHKGYYPKNQRVDFVANILLVLYIFIFH